MDTVTSTRSIEIKVLQNSPDVPGQFQKYLQDSFFIVLRQGNLDCVALVFGDGVVELLDGLVQFVGQILVDLNEQ